MLSFDMAVAPGRTHRYYTGEPLWEFGHGLSYTTFTVSAMPSGSDATVTVVNTGDRDGDETVFVYAKAAAGVIPDDEPASKLQRQLVGFSRIGPIAAGSSDALTFDITPDTLMLTDSKGADHFFVGDYTITLSTGSSSATLTASCTATACTLSK